MNLLVATVLATMMTASNANEDNPLIAERWHTRPLVVVVSSAVDPFLAEIETALDREATRAGFVEREMVFYKVVAGVGTRDGKPLTPRQTANLLNAVGASARGPRSLFLIGKDGGVKVAERRSVSLEALFSTIDAMPMRRR